MYGRGPKLQPWIQFVRNYVTLEFDRLWSIGQDNKACFPTDLQECRHYAWYSTVQKF